MLGGSRLSAPKNAQSLPPIRACPHAHPPCKPCRRLKNPPSDLSSPHTAPCSGPARLPRRRAQAFTITCLHMPRGRCSCQDSDSHAAACERNFESVSTAALSVPEPRIISI